MAMRVKHLVQCFTYSRSLKVVAGLSFHKME